MFEIKFDTKSLEEFAKKVERGSRRVEQALGKDFADMVEIHEKAVIDEAPRDSGKMANSIRSIRTKRFVWRIVATARTKIGGYLVSRLVRFGWSRNRRIYARSKKALYWTGAGHPVRSVGKARYRGNRFEAKAIVKTKSARATMAKKIASNVAITWLGKK